VSGRAPSVLFLVLAVAFAIAGCGGSNKESTTGRDTNAIAGNWTGELSQQGLPPFRIAVAINGNGGAGVAYTGINCAGVWIAMDGNPPNTYEFTEQIKFGSGGNCKGTGTVNLRRAAARLDYTFHGGGVTSTGVLSRTTHRDLANVFRQAGAFTIPGEAPN
jgi:hypothetical protein